MFCGLENIILWLQSSTSIAECALRRSFSKIQHVLFVFLLPFRNRQKHSRHCFNKCKIVITEMWLRVNYSKINSSHGFVDTLHYKFYLQNSTKLTTWESTYAELPWGGVGEVILSTRKFELLMVFRRLLLLFWTVIMLLLVFVFDVGIVVPISSPPVTKCTTILRK